MNIEERLVSLESSNRTLARALSRMRTALMLVVSCSAVLLLAAFRPGAEYEFIRTKRLQIVGEKNPSLPLVDIGVRGDGTPMLTMSNDEGHFVVSLGANQAGTGYVGILDGAGRQLGELIGNRWGHGALRIYGSGGHLLGQFGGDEHAAGELRNFVRRTETLSFETSVLGAGAKDGVGYLQMLDGRGSGVATFPIPDRDSPAEKSPVPKSNLGTKPPAHDEGPVELGVGPAE